MTWWSSIVTCDSSHQLFLSPNTSNQNLSFSKCVPSARWCIHRPVCVLNSSLYRVGRSQRCGFSTCRWSTPWAKPTPAASCNAGTKLSIMSLTLSWLNRPAVTVSLPLRYSCVCCPCLPVSPAQLCWRPSRSWWCLGSGCPAPVCSPSPEATRGI